MPSFGGEVKLSVPCRRFVACKRSLHLPWKSHAVGKTGSAISRPYLRPSLIEVSHVAGRGAPLEMTGLTKSGAQRARSYGLGASGLQGPGSAPYSTLLSTTSGANVYSTFPVYCVEIFLMKQKYEDVECQYCSSALHALRL
jgi:hypothetical protein